MIPFLQLVANDLRARFGNDLSRLTVVFPNKRAELFMNEYLLAPDAQHPVWAPRYTTIDALFRSLSPLVVNDSIDTACRIAQLYEQLSGDDIALDLFYGWAERILADFDDVDKNRADARALFTNLGDLKTLDQTDYLTDEQVKVLQRFFADFDPTQKSEIRERFLRLWETLLPLYEQLNSCLEAEGLAYEGALYRRVVEQLEREEIEIDTAVQCFVFVGFNVLDEVERSLLEHLKKNDRALFYWDYDEFYTFAHPHFEAGIFLRENLLRFPNALGREHFDNFRHIQHFEMVAASTEVVQAQSVGPWLETHLTPDSKRTAVVLCNERVLQPVLHALPENVEEVNITKGYPLAHTQAATLVEREFYDLERAVQTRLTSSAMLQNVLAKLETQMLAYAEEQQGEDESFEHILQSEGYVLMGALLNRLLLIAQSGRLNVNAQTLRRIVRQIMRQSSVPFHGEPVAGLQVMGVLETRCLDFEHLILLSVNEGNLPQNTTDNSFIPLLLRRAFGLTTPERRTAVYAYYFYRLIQRAKRVRFLYNTSTEGLSQGEMSRFLTQLLVESPLPIEHLALVSPQDTIVNRPTAIDKPADLRQRLTRRSTLHPEEAVLSLSPSALGEYLRCPLSFYYKYVMRYREPAPDPDEIQANALGTIFHKAAELIYADFLTLHEGRVTPQELKALAANKERLGHYVERAFEEADVAHYQVLEAHIVQMLLIDMLLVDARLGEFRYLASELPVAMRLPLPAEAGGGLIEIGGTIDRLDLVDTEETRLRRIVDYKTGKYDTEKVKASSLPDIFERRGAKNFNYILQTFIYSHIYAQQQERATNIPLAPVLFFISQARKPNYRPYLQINKEEILDFEAQIPDFSSQLTDLLTEILRLDTPFCPTEDTNACKNCIFYALCYQ
ncbi:MAG: PD-(D/E)XK nuclease family protein [Bacteroidales bacterium]|nr:PD-(D/E)XK nuclease family protein [Bacteroidales bacterium]